MAWLLLLGSIASADVLDSVSGLMAGSARQPLPQIVEVIARDQRGIGRGSGSLVYVDSEYGYILTNWHVVAEGEQIDVRFPDGFNSPGTTVRTDEEWDLALVRIWRPPVPPILVAGVVPQPGDWLTIAGYGQGTYRAARGKCIHYAAPDTQRPFEMVELAVEARQGDSGGPILNERGELAGVLFGAGDGATTGSHIGRVKTFLDETFIEQQRLAQNLPTANSPVARSEVPPAFMPSPEITQETLRPDADRLVQVPGLEQAPIGQAANEFPTANVTPEENLPSTAIADTADMPADALEPIFEMATTANSDQIVADSIIPPPSVEPPPIDRRPQARIVANTSTQASQPLPTLSVPMTHTGQRNGWYGTRGFTLDRSLAERLWESTKSVLAIVGAIAIIFQFAKASVRNRG